MELQPLAQAAALLQTSRTPAIIIPKHPSTDALAAALALLIVLEKLGKNPRVVCQDFSLPPGHGFLPKSDAVQRSLASLQTFTINVDVSRTPLDSLSYDMQSDRLRIHLTPKDGYYEPRDVTTDGGTFAYDLILTLDVISLQHLGSLYEQNTEFFYRTPLLNIDHRSSNTRFGQTNLVDVVASSVSEIVFELIKSIGFELLDEHIATNLLAGIISKTKIFQAQTVTPRSLAIASHLMTAGARRGEIIRHLYQTKSLAALKLWGRALAKLHTTKQDAILWSSISQDDLRATNAAPEEAPGVIDELMVNAPRARIVVLFIETAGGTTVHVSRQSDAPLPSLKFPLQAVTPTYAVGKSPQPLAATEKDVIAALEASAL